MNFFPMNFATKIRDKNLPLTSLYIEAEISENNCKFIFRKRDRTKAVKCIISSFKILGDKSTENNEKQ
jgi:hypothetical protein